MEKFKLSLRIHTTTSGCGGCFTNSIDLEPNMSNDEFQEYDESFVNALELIWGEGYLSPGGAEEVRRIVGDYDLCGKKVLDIGCGSGGIDRLLVEDLGAEHVTGIDTEPSLIALCQQRVKGTELEHRFSFAHVNPGPLPYSDKTFDTVFSKDSMIHIEDKLAICQEVYRVLKPGGVFIASDWMSGDEPASLYMDAYIKQEGLDFGMGNQQQYRKALEVSYFKNIEFTDRNAWYTEVAKREYRSLSTDLYEQLVDAAGQESADHGIATWEAMIVVLERGELRPTHFQALKKSSLT